MPSLGGQMGWGAMASGDSLLTLPLPRCIQINTDSGLLNSEFCFILKVKLWVWPGTMEQGGGLWAVGNGLASTEPPALPSGSL